MSQIILNATCFALLQHAASCIRILANWHIMMVTINVSFEGLNLWLVCLDSCLSASARPVIVRESSTSSRIVGLV